MFTIQEFKEKKAQIAEQQKELQNSLKSVFNKGTKELFDKYPSHLGQIFWTQYTPYFNDGDPCEFTMGEFYVNGQESCDYNKDAPEFLNSLYTEEELVIRGNWKPIDRYDYKPFENGLSPERIEEFRIMEEEVQNFLNLFDYEDYRFMFGEHVEITITKDGISVEEYCHD